jgi:Fe-S oxidoreductase
MSTISGDSLTQIVMLACVLILQIADMVYKAFLHIKASSCSSLCCGCIMQGQSEEEKEGNATNQETEMSEVKKRLSVVVDSIQ